MEFAFEFDVVSGTSYPYSDVFWTAEQSAEETVDNIEIELGGAIRNVNIYIKVNGEEVVHETNCDHGFSKYFKQEDKIRIKTYKTANYALNAQKVYARKSADGLWTCLLNETNGDHTVFVDDSEGYVEFGFEFDITWGRDWPYSGVFWTAEQSEKEKVDDIYIDMTGTTLYACLEIFVNGNKIFSQDNLPSGYQHYWKTLDKIRVRTYKTTNYKLWAQKVYARKAGGKWVCVLNKTNGDHTIYIDNDYVEFGFEFDIIGWSKYAYSGVFWTAADSEREKVEDIYIEMTGTVFKGCLDIYVNDKKIYSNEDLPGTPTQYKW